MWEIVAEDLGLEITAPFLLVLPSGIQIETMLLVKKFGVENGMLIIKDFEQIADFIDEIKSANYGFSVLEEPGENEVYSRQAFIELLKDWGWSGDEENKPKWLT